MPKRDVVSWNAMIDAYGKNRQGKEAIKLFHRMEAEGIDPDEATFVTMLEICATLASIQQGEAVYRRIRRSKYKRHTKVLNALIHMYGCCGSLIQAKEAFSRLGRPDEFSFTTLMSACSRNDHSREALEILPYMILQGVDPSSVTFLVVLSACSSAGYSPDEARGCFVAMIDDFSLLPSSEHYDCFFRLMQR
ncbi:hypothetical protein SELMODRAFT_16948, partial [Selaginella moellendorffii]